MTPVTPQQADQEGRALHMLVEAGGVLVGVARWKHALWVAGGVWTAAAEAAGTRTVQAGTRVALAAFARACRELAFAEGEELARRWGPAVAADTCPAWPHLVGRCGKPTVGIIAAADALWRGDRRWYATVSAPQRREVTRLMARLGLEPGAGAGR